jgi:uncharacterized protein with HEPN domain
MSKRDPSMFLIDMLESIEKVERYTAGLTFDAFEGNDMVLDAVVRNLEIIGEAAGRIPATMREQYTQIEWSRVVGFRNIVIHAYFAVDVEIVWTIATQRLAELKAVLREMLQDHGSADRDRENT